MKQFWNDIKDYVFIVIAVLLIRTFLCTPAIVDGSSMDTTLAAGQWYSKRSKRCYFSKN